VIVAGIDEAGLGPVLGPLVISAVAFSMSAELASLPMWDTLSAAVGHKPSKRSGKIAFADSKKLYTSRSEGGIANLERGVLTMLGRAGVKPASLPELLQHVCPQVVGPMAKCPWYSHRSLSLPRMISQTSVDLGCNSLSLHMDQAGIAGPMMMQAEVILEGEFNRLIQATDNKSIATFDVLCRLLVQLWKLSPGQDMLIVVDRQGGRTRYLDKLQQIFPGCAFKILDETPLDSAYRITDSQRKVEIHFMVEAEDQHLPVALASMLSKYLRELLMELFNGYWIGQLPQIKPTAGYYTDGTRFYREIQGLLGPMGISPDMIWRQR
jgi:ribonuclease HII